MIKVKYPVITPFKIDVSPMERLLLVNFEKDPDSVYMGFEPQVFNDGVHGKGHLVIGWRLDGKVDVYHEASLSLDPETYNITGKGLGNMVETDFIKALYEVDELGVQASYEFEDLHHRMVKVILKENFTKKRKPFGLLAPMGAAAENPFSMPLVLLHDFYFVRKKSTEIHIHIGEKSHQADELPLPIDGSKMLFTRYSPKPLIVTFNPAFDGIVTSTEVEPEKGRITLPEDEVDLEIEWVDRSPRIKRIIRKNNIHPLILEFTEAFPDILGLMKEDNFKTIVKGGFSIQFHPSIGSVGGEYSVEKIHDQIKITLIPSKGWHAKPTKLSLFILYNVAKIFKSWPKTYEWTALLKEDEEGRLFMQSKWKRT